MKQQGFGSTGGVVLPAGADGHGPGRVAWLGLLVSLAGCGDAASRTAGAGVPTTPVLVVGEALVSGRVVGADGMGVPGATVLVAETDAKVTADDGGAYRIQVPSDSTVTLMASATGLAPTFRESVTVASQAMIDGFDFRLLPLDRITAANALGSPGQESTRGLMAVRLHALDAACVLAGARLSVWPPQTAKVVYSRPTATAGAMDTPDPVVDGVQPETTISAWLTAVVPPGNGITIGVEQPGCKVMTPSPSLGGLLFPGLRHVAVQSLTEVDLFLGRAP